ncbi:MAG TPA: trypsin-like peptidase domain-containing protein [Usitatibacter sp.]|nr:trypsin-like peptidase domain-containing protein [Usitatibacter sp.]
MHERWILTAHHVIDIPDLAHRFRATFNNVSGDGTSTPFDYRLDPDQGFFPSADGIQGASGESFDLDYLFVAIAGPYPQEDPSLANLARVSLRPLAVGDRAHILQSDERNPLLRFPVERLRLYPQGGRVRHVDADYAYYQVSTHPGTSGSPVFDDNWNLRALHTTGYQSEFPDALRQEYNFGTLMARIVADVRMRHPAFPVDELLTIAGTAPAGEPA